MSDINTDTTVDGQIETSSDSSSVDELEGMFLNPEHRTSRKDSKAAKPKKSDDDDGPEETKQAPAKDTSKSKDLRPNGKDDTPPAKKEGKETQAGEGKKEDPAKLEAEKARKAFKGKFGDQDLDLDEDTEFTVKIDGQDVKIKAKDLFDNYSGKVAWDKRFNDLNIQRRTFMGEQHKFDGLKNQIKTMFQEQDPNIRLFKMAQLAGVSPIEFRRNFYDQTIQDIEKYSVLSDDERKARDLEFENHYLKFQADAAQKSLADQQALTDLETKVKTLTRKSGISEKQFHSALEQIVSSTADPRQKAMFEREGKFAHGYPTPEFVVEVVQKEALWESASSALDGVKLDWSPQERGERLMSLVEDAFKNGISPADLPDVVSEIWGKARSKRVVERVEREREEHFEGTKPSGQSSFRHSAHEPVFFDDLNQ